MSRFSARRRQFSVRRSPHWEKKLFLRKGPQPCHNVLGVCGVQGSVLRWWSSNKEWLPRQRHPWIIHIANGYIGRNQTLSKKKPSIHYVSTSSLTPLFLIVHDSPSFPRNRGRNNPGCPGSNCRGAPAIWNQTSEMLIIGNFRIIKFDQKPFLVHPFDRDGPRNANDVVFSGAIFYFVVHRFVGSRSVQHSLYPLFSFSKARTSSLSMYSSQFKAHRVFFPDLSQPIKIREPRAGSEKNKIFSLIFVVLNCPFLDFFVFSRRWC